MANMQTLIDTAMNDEWSMNKLGRLLSHYFATKDNGVWLIAVEEINDV